jgi:hypothetical protein
MQACRQLQFTDDKLSHFMGCSVDYERRGALISIAHRIDTVDDVVTGFLIDARLHHFAAGWHMARRVVYR